MDEWDPANGKYNRIWGSIFGGAEDGHVLGDTHVEVEGGTIGTYGYTSAEGNVFGGGKGKADTFLCEKAMIGKDGDGVNNPDGGTQSTRFDQRKRSGQPSVNASSHSGWRRDGS